MLSLNRSSQFFLWTKFSDVSETTIEIPQFSWERHSYCRNSILTPLVVAPSGHQIINYPFALLVGYSISHFKILEKNRKKNYTDEDQVYTVIFSHSMCVIKGHGKLLALKWWFDELTNSLLLFLTHAFWSIRPTLMEISWRKKCQYLCPITALKVLFVSGGQGTWTLQVQCLWI